MFVVFYLERLQAQWGDKVKNEKSPPWLFSGVYVPWGCIISLLWGFPVLVPYIFHFPGSSNLGHRHPLVTEPMPGSLNNCGPLLRAPSCPEVQCPTVNPPHSSSYLCFSITHLVAQVKNLRDIFDSPFFLNLKYGPFDFCFGNIS